MNASLGGTHEIRRFKIERGRELQPDEPSTNGLYGIVSAQKGKLLRVAMSREQALFLCDFKSRHLQEVSLRPD